MEEEKLLKRRKRAKEEQNPEHLASSLKKLAELYHSQGRYDKALAAYEEERELWVNIGKPMLAAVANRMMGEIYCSLGQYKDALRKLKEYFDVATAENNLIEEQRALATIGRTYFFMAESVSPTNELEYKKALREAKQAYLMSLKICDKLNNVNRYELWQMRSRLMMNIGLVLECQGDMEKAVEHIEKAITINKRADLFEDTFRCYSSMASLYQRQRNSALSLKFHDLALEVAERLQDKTQLIYETLMSKADVYFSVANYRAAKHTLTKAYRVCKSSSEDKSLIERNLKIAHVLCESEEKLITLSDDDQNTKKQLYEVMGDACCFVKNFNQAITYYLKMLECCEALGYCGRDLLPALISLSQTYRDAGKYEEALKFLQRELDVWEDNPEEACKTSLNIFELLERKKASYNDLIESIKKSHDYALIANNETLEIKVLKKMLRIQEKFGFMETAGETRSKLDSIKTDVSSSECSDTSDADDSEDASNVETPEMINNISLSDILDEPEPVNVEISHPRQVRRQPQGVKIRRNEKGETQLQVACIVGNYQRVKQLIDLKHPVNVTDNGGWTPLHEVCNHGYTELVELLLDNGADINDAGGDGCEGVTPLHDACSNGHLQIVQILLDRGAVIDVRTNDNKTPLDFLMEWASRAGNLSQDNKALFDSIKERLKSGLEKAGLITDSVNVPSVQHSTGRSTERKLSQKPKYISRKPKNKEFGGKRSWTVVRSDSSSSDSDREQTIESAEDDGYDNAATIEREFNGDHDSNSGSLVFSPVLVEEDPALEYQKVMKGLRKKVIQEPSKKYDNLSKTSAFVEDTDVDEDWLIDDIKDLGRPNKKRKIQEFDKGGGKLIGTLRKDVVIFGDDDSLRFHESEDMEIEEIPSESEVKIQLSNRHLTLPVNTKKRICTQQSSLLDSGYICVKTEDTTHQIDTVPPSVMENTPCIPTVKVHIEDVSLVVPISSKSSVPLTIDWLAKEAATRYLKLEGKEPMLILHTKDGAKLVADDPLTIIDNREVIGQVTGWKTVSLMQQYVDACKAVDTECDLQIKNCLEKSDVTHSLNLNNCGYYLESLKPFIQSLKHEHSLKELLLGSNALMDDGIEMLSMMNGLPLLEVLDLSCNNITVLGLTSLSNFLSHCQYVKVLDLSFNDFCEDGWLESIHKITEALNALISLNLGSCGLDGNEFATRRGDPPLSNIRSLEDLDISYNELGECGVKGFLQHLNTMCIKKLNVAGTALENSKSMPQIIKFFQRDDPKNIRFLDLSDCFITDSELKELIRCLETANHFETFLLRNNSSLSACALENLFKMQKIPSCLDLCECDSLFSSSNEETDRFWLNDEVVKQLYSLSMTFDETETYGSVFCDKVKEQWKQIWGDRAEMYKGPSGFLKLELVKTEED